MLKKAKLLTRPTLADISPAHPEAAKTASSPKDAPFRQARPQRAVTFRGGWDDPNCARRTSTFLSCAFREQGDRPSYPIPLFQPPPRALPREFDQVCRSQLDLIDAESSGSAHCPSRRVRRYWLLLPVHPRAILLSDRLSRMRCRLEW